MNSVVDDSKVLTLTNPTRITFPQQVSFLFEVQDLQEASHATVYRCGIIFMDTADFGWQPFIRSWVERMEMDQKRHSTAEVLRKIVERHTEMALEVRREQCQELIPSTDLNGIRSFTRLFDWLTKKENGFDPESQDSNFSWLFFISLISNV
ncbi:putative Dynein axonemal heavy chain 2 [Blattamonas nauphoetae]|uniref:Dynein axonemal heavy chain 2 n=1 Tax=Blattamonas nauphoetae TaxID=2049346 RepID=A0ABQ9Y410_9EUKA|nr:putative Dynein axonemal heavy chain 2 [Blattamonas nauphoetae]